MARAAEIFAERWTPLVVRELLAGSTRFSELQKGVPRMSSALLSRRLKELEYLGIVERKPSEEGRGSTYHLTSAGSEMFPIVESMGNWAQRWVRADLVADENLDPDLLMWDVRRNVKGDLLNNQTRVVVQFEFDGVPSSRRRYWLVFERGDADLCIRDPGYDVNLHVSSPIRTLVEVWLGHLSIDTASREGRLRFAGDPADINAFKNWFALGHFAPAGREPPGQDGADQ